MSIATQALRYGWVALAGLAITGGTIFVQNNTSRRITPATRIEIILGTVERGLVTKWQDAYTNIWTSQYANIVYTDYYPAAYLVAPPDFVRTWYSNSYVTQVVDGVTSIVAVLHSELKTNAINWRDDYSMKVALDNTIKAFPPAYLDTNTVFDGSSNIAMLTVTGLWTALAIGDGTNQFTRVPCWTNNVGQTNCTTNAATYGPWDWRNYVLPWQERFKVLHAAKATTRSVRVKGHRLTSSYQYSVFGETSTTEQIYAQMETHFNAMLAEVQSDSSYVTNGAAPNGNSNYWNGGYSWSCSLIDEQATAVSKYFKGAYRSTWSDFFQFYTYDLIRLDRIAVFDSTIPTNVASRLDLYVYPTEPSWFDYVAYDHYAPVNPGPTAFSNPGKIWLTNRYNLASSSAVTNGRAISPLIFADTAPIATNIVFGCTIQLLPVFDWNFAYCTNKFW
jgi:hypothetical protein